MELIEAIEEGDIEAVKQAIATGADVNAKDDFAGWTALHGAVAYDHKEVVELLIAEGADVNAQSGDGTPLDMTGGGDEKPDNKEIADLLRKHGGKTSDTYG